MQVRILAQVTSEAAARARDGLGQPLDALLAKHEERLRVVAHAGPYGHANEDDDGPSAQFQVAVATRT